MELFAALPGDQTSASLSTLLHVYLVDFAKNETLSLDWLQFAFPSCRLDYEKVAFDSKGNFHKRRSPHNPEG